MKKLKIVAAKKLRGAPISIVWALLMALCLTSSAEAKNVNGHRHTQDVTRPVDNAGSQAAQPSLPQSQPESQQSESAPTALPSNLPLKRDSDASIGVGSIPIVMLSGILLLGALLIAIRFYISKRRSGKKGTAGAQTGWFGLILPRKHAANLQIVSCVQLSRDSRVHVIGWRGFQYLLASNEHAFTVLERFPDPSSKEPPESIEKCDASGSAA